MKNTEDLENRVRIFSALGDETRLRIILFLRDGEHCACEIPGAVGKSQPTVSQHLRILKDAGLLKSRKDGKRVLYRVCCDKVFRVIREMGGV